MNLNTFLVEYEPDEGTDAGAAAVAPAPPTEGDAAAVASEPSVGATEPSAPAFDPSEIQAELEYLRTQNAQFAQLLQGVAAQAQPTTGQQQPSGLPAFDPFDADSVRAWQDARDQQLLAAIDQRFSAVSSRFAQQDALAQQAEGEQRIEDVIADDVSRNGEYASDPEADRQARATVRALAEQLFPEYAQRYGAGPRAGELALSKAAAQVRSLLSAAGTTAVTQRDNELANLAGVRGEPGTGASAGVPGVSAPAADLRRPSLAAKYGRD